MKSLLIQIFWFTAILSLCLWLSSCSPQKRLNRIVKNNPELLENDTIEIRDTIINNTVRVDTALEVHNILDTVYITEDRLKIKTVYRDNKIYIEGECTGDTVFIEKKVPVERVVIKELTFWQKNRSWIIPVLVLIIGSGIAKKIGLF